MNPKLNWRLKHIPIAVKLITITMSLLLFVAGAIAFTNAAKFEKISAGREAAGNMDQSRARASEVENALLAYIDKAKVTASLLLKDTGGAEERERSLELTFRRDQDLVSVEVIPRVPLAEPLRVVNESYLNQYGGRDKYFLEVLRATQKARHLIDTDLLFSGKEGVIEIRNSTVQGVPLFTVGFPFAKDDFGNVTHIVLAEIRLDRLQKVGAAMTERTLYLVDRDGKLLAHPEEQRVLNGESYADVPIVKTALGSEVKQGQLHYNDLKSQEPITAAFTKTALGVIVIAAVDDKIILEPAQIIKRESFYITGRILSVTLFFIFLFSISLTTPIENLVELTTKVAKGDFTVEASVHSRDEVGQLGRAFNQMIQGLVERDRVKNMFSKFHGSSVTEDLMKGDLQLGGSKKMVTVFFSDVRDFTKFSEGHTPEEVVAMLNEYFQIMVKIINDHGGVVDKFIGDAIMAVWGAPNATELDPQNCVRACLEMRVALAELNVRRIERGQVPIKIGMGVHRGEAISGTIGSEERMEYTVIGDTVNQASRIEASTKAFGTDLLLSEDLAEHVGAAFVCDVAGSVEVKGKSEPLKLFKVRGYVGEDLVPVIIKTPYSDYESGEVDKVKVA